MPRKTTGPIVSALAAAALLAGAGPAVSATVMEARNISVFHGVTTHDSLFDFTDVTTAFLHFDAFDPSLGTLTGAEWRLRTNAGFNSGVSVLGEGFAELRIDRSTSYLDLDGVVLGAFPEVLTPYGGLACAVFDHQFCVRIDHQAEAYNLDVAANDLAPFLAPGGVDIAAVSKIRLEGLLFGDGFGTANGTLDWSGQLSLVYSYDPAASLPPVTGVPEPGGWALALTGFALAGGALRRRRGQARA